MTQKKIERLKTNGGIIKNTEKYQYRVMLGTPTTGLVRAEWVHARYSQIIPTNWSALTVAQFMSSLFPIEYQIADAYNLILKSAIEGNVEWLLTIESDNILPLDGFIRMTEYMRKGDIPVVSALYFTKSVPPEPLLYRQSGMGYFDKWKLGDKVWVSGIPMGFTLYHMSLLKAMWRESPEYIVSGTTTRRVFETPGRNIYDPARGGMVSETGTQDLEWCKTVISGNFLEKAGWGQFVKKHPKYPFLVDTNLFVRHISTDGVQFPIEVPSEFISPEQYKGREIID
jgi:hypothetical protein